MEHITTEEIAVSAGAVDDLFIDAEPMPEPAMPHRINHDKLHAVLCIAASALLSVTALAWILFG
jgi:hypothetical protein